MNRPLRATLWFLALAGATPAPAADPLLEADQLYRDQKFPAAIERLVELSLERPGDAEVQDRLGAARFRSGDFEGAARAYETAARLRGGDANELYNAGNAYYKAGRLVDAAERYGQALSSDPSHADAAHNRELVEKEIAARRAMPPPPPPKPQSGGDDPNDQQGEDQPNDDQQQPQPGDQQQSGEPQAGQPQPGDPSQDPNQDPQDGQADGEASQDPNNASRGQGGSSQPPPQDPGSSDAVSPTGLTDPSQQPPDGDPTATAAGEAGQDDNAGPITAGQAHRLLDAIEEGGQRVVVQGKSGQKPW